MSMVSRRKMIVDAYIFVSIDAEQRNSELMKTFMRFSVGEALLEGSDTKRHFELAGSVIRI
jgi:hypothetical protein